MWHWPKRERPTQWKAHWPGGSVYLIANSSPINAWDIWLTWCWGSKATKYRVNIQHKFKIQRKSNSIIIKRRKKFQSVSLVSRYLFVVAESNVLLPICSDIKVNTRIFMFQDDIIKTFLLPYHFKNHHQTVCRNINSIFNSIRRHLKPYFKIYTESGLLQQESWTKCLHLDGPAFKKQAESFCETLEC